MCSQLSPLLSVSKRKRVALGGAGSPLLTSFLRCQNIVKYRIRKKTPWLMPHLPGNCITLSDIDPIFSYQIWKGRIMLRYKAGRYCLKQACHLTAAATACLAQRPCTVLLRLNVLYIWKNSITQSKQSIPVRQKLLQGVGINCFSEGPAGLTSFCLQTPGECKRK